MYASYTRIGKTRACIFLFKIALCVLVLSDTMLTMTICMFSVSSTVPIEGPQVTDAKGKPILRAVLMVHEPSMNAGIAESMLTWSLQRVFQHVSTHTAQQAFVHIAHETLHVIAHAAHTVQILWKYILYKYDAKVFWIHVQRH